MSLTFLTSGILHEYLFDIAAWEAKGLLLAFFAIQGLGVLMSPALERAAKSLGTAGSILARLFTILFVISSTVLFFSALDKICPGFYSADLFLP